MAAEETRAALSRDVGVADQHPALEARAIYVAPSDASRANRNTGRTAMLPAACWKLEDICFDFASVFLLPEAKEAFAGLAKLWKDETLWKEPPVLALFGHADPVGKLPFNQRLSEDRAKIVHAVLVRDRGVWEEVFKRRKQVEDLRRGLIAYEGDKFLLKTEKGGYDAAVRSAVQRYMDELSPDLELAAEDFLLKGEAAWQGCGELNPVVVFSRDQTRELAKQDRHAERNAENRPNRRVMGFLWKRSAPLPEKRESWPCPKADDGMQPCHDHFWEGRDERRKPRELGRQWDRTVRPGDPPRPAPPSTGWTYEPACDTFACFHYQKLASFSPCERAVPPSQDWKILVRAFEDSVRAKYRDRTLMGCAFYMDFEVHVRIQKDTPSGPWKLKLAKIVGVDTRIEPDFDKETIVLLKKNYWSKRKVLALQGTDLHAELRPESVATVTGKLDANLQKYARRPDSMFVVLYWPVADFPADTPGARLTWKYNTTETRIEWKEEYPDGHIETHWMNPSAPGVTDHDAYHVYYSDLGSGITVPLAPGELVLEVTTSDQPLPWRWVRVRTKRM